jgi:hypothetical protein
MVMLPKAKGTIVIYHDARKYLSTEKIFLSLAIAFQNKLGI